MQQATFVFAHDIQPKNNPDGGVLESRRKPVNGKVRFDAPSEAAAHAINAFVAVLVEVAIELDDPRVLKALRTAMSDFSDYLVPDVD